MLTIKNIFNLLRSYLISKDKDFKNSTTYNIGGKLSGGVDVCLVHAPSIYDFRAKQLRPGPISDVIPSTPVFEMYPIGFVSMLAYLVKHGYKARIANVALQMLSNGTFDVERYLRKIDAKLFGIDLHWLPHVHGAYHISKIIKSIHPDSKIVLGGFSATYFSDEIMKEWPWIDYVLCGDYQEEPLLKLVEAVEKGGDLSAVSNLVYHGDNGSIKKNPRDKNPEAIKRVFIDYRVLVKNTIRYHDIRGHLPYYAWLKNPEAFTLIEHGCQFSCGFCGGSKFAYSNRYGFLAPVFRDPATIALEMEIAQETLGAPIFISGDLCAAGEKYYKALFNETKNRGIDIPLLTEYFVPPNRDYWNELSKVFPDFSAEISPDSSVEWIRRLNGRNYTNAALEESIGEAMKAGCRKFDAYFMIGIYGQGKQDVMADVEYAKYLMKKYNTQNMNLDTFITPLAPFLDPGSLFFEMPEKYGHRLKAKHLMEFYELLEKGRCWEDYLNYETSTMCKSDIAEATYMAGINMVKAEAEAGKIDKETEAMLTSQIIEYAKGENGVTKKGPKEHMAYLTKQIEWSKKHRITPTYAGIVAYRIYNSIIGRSETN